MWCIECDFVELYASVFDGCVELEGYGYVAVAVVLMCAVADGHAW